MADDRTVRDGSGGDWKKESWRSVDEAGERGNYRHTRYRGGLPRKAIEALERAKNELIEKEKNDISGNGQR